jgi:chromosome segregation ATPase
MTITLDVVVTLPRHEQPDDLSEDLRAKWERFAARIAAHEQRHVDISLDGATAMKARMGALLTKRSWSSCSEFEKHIHDLWRNQQADTEEAQEEFHVEDKAKIETDRKPLQAQVDVHQARLAVIASQIRTLDLTGEGLRNRLDAATAEIAKSGAIAAHNALVEEHNAVARRRNVLAEEHNQLAAVTNGLVDALNWTR